jgi:NAD(P)H-hydrate repair Nnr-like enzyme with NAD(P)H-hydrate dehydratase domain
MDAASDLARECDAIVVVTGSLNVVARARRWGDARR